VEETDRRRHARYPCNARVKITRGEVTWDATLHDISASGMYIDTHEPLWVRTEFSARALFPEALSVTCIVRHVDAGQGMVVEFTELSEESRMNLNHPIWRLSHP